MSALLHHLTAGAERLRVVLEARQLQRARALASLTALSRRELGAAVGVPWQTLYKWMKRVEKLEDASITAEHLADQTWKIPGRPRQVQLSKPETEAVRANKLLSNRNRDSGSTPEAIRQTAREGGLRPEVCVLLLERHERGLPMVPQATRDELHISPAITHSFRNARNGWLRHIEAPGSLYYITDEVTGQKRLVRPGEAATIDDGTKNFICTVPLERPHDKCWQNFRCIVGRWQILLMVDHRTHYVTACVHTARPKSQYRAEDITATFQISGLEHGVPRLIFLEKGISKSELIHNTLNLLGVKYEHVSSPHRKVVEAVFNALWTKLSFLPGQVGRVRGEEDQVDAIFRSCQNGATDPREYFLPLDRVLKALHEVIAEHNAHTMTSRVYGWRWVPSELWAAEAKEHLRPIHPNDAWMFSPAVASGTEGTGLLVRGSSVPTSFLVMPGLSLRFDFQAPWLTQFYGARIKFYYNPFVTGFRAFAVLGADYGEHKAGTRLGYVDQVNLHTRVSRGLLGFGAEPDIGLELARKSAQALYRSGFAIRPDGKPGVQRHETRDGLGNAQIVEAGARHIAPAPAPRAGERPIEVPRPLRERAQGVSQDEFDRQAARLQRDEERARRLAASVSVVND